MLGVASEAESELSFGLGEEHLKGHGALTPILFVGRTPALSWPLEEASMFKHHFLVSFLLTRTRLSFQWKFRLLTLHCFPRFRGLARQINCVSISLWVDLE